MQRSDNMSSSQSEDDWESLCTNQTDIESEPMIEPFHNDELVQVIDAMTESIELQQKIITQQVQINLRIDHVIEHQVARVIHDSHLNCYAEPVIIDHQQEKLGKLVLPENVIALINPRLRVQRIEHSNLRRLTCDEYKIQSDIQLDYLELNRFERTMNQAKNIHIKHLVINHSYERDFAWAQHGIEFLDIVPLQTRVNRLEKIGHNVYKFSTWHYNVKHLTLRCVDNDNACTIIENIHDDVKFLRIVLPNIKGYKIKLDKSIYGTGVKPRKVYFCREGTPEAAKDWAFQEHSEPTTKKYHLILISS